jgi:hypothetical protein
MMFEAFEMCVIALGVGLTFGAFVGLFEAWYAGRL